MSLSPGTRLGHYDITALLGEGGMGDDVSLRSMNRSQSFDNSTLALLRMSEAEGRLVRHSLGEGGRQEEAGSARTSPCRIT